MKRKFKQSTMMVNNSININSKKQQCDVGHPVPGLGQAHNCTGVKPDNEVPIIRVMYFVLVLYYLLCLSQSGKYSPTGPSLHCIIPCILLL